MDGWMDGWMDGFMHGWIGYRVNPVETEFHESMRFHGISWNFMKLKLMKFHEIFHGISLNFDGMFFHEKKVS
jgi:hypothetical protein